MNLQDVWDWTFMWQMVRNFMATVSPFVMIITAVGVVGMLLIIVTMIIKYARSK